MPTYVHYPHTHRNYKNVRQCSKGAIFLSSKRTNGGKLELLICPLMRVKQHYHGAHPRWQTSSKTLMLLGRRWRLVRQSDRGDSVSWAHVLHSVRSLLCQHGQYLHTIAEPSPIHCVKCVTKNWCLYSGIYWFSCCKSRFIVFIYTSQLTHTT